MAELFVNNTKRIKIEFDRELRSWDGFGFNYVEVSQSEDYGKDPQEYGGFSLLSDEQRNEILDLVFGEDGLKPGTIKMFLDPFHQKENNLNPRDPVTIEQSNYDHESSTRWMRYFIREGLKRTRQRGSDLSVFTSLFGPPAFMTKQKLLRGRDVDPEMKTELAKYIVSWAQFLRDKEGIPVKYIAFHNEGEDHHRWPEDGSHGNIGTGNDYNMYWPPEQVAEFIKLTRPILDANGMRDVGIAPGETTNWFRFSHWGYADAIAADDEAVRTLGLISSHGFKCYNDNIWFADHRSTGIDAIRAKRPELHAWVTSTSWSAMDVFFIFEMFNNIYSAKVNSIIPWAGLQVPGRWVGGDPNPGTAFNITEDGTYQVRRGYYYYKQICRAGQPGMKVCRIRTNDSQLSAAAFGNGGTGNPDAFLIINTSEDDRTAVIQVSGTEATEFTPYRTTDSGEKYKALDPVRLRGEEFRYTAPGKSVTTFYG